MTKCFVTLMTKIVVTLLTILVKKNRDGLFPWALYAEGRMASVHAFTLLTKIMGKICHVNDNSDCHVNDKNRCHVTDKKMQKQ